MNIIYAKPLTTVSVATLEVGDCFVLGLNYPTDVYIVYGFDGEQMDCVRFRQEGLLPLEISLEKVSLEYAVYLVNVNLNVTYVEE